MLPKKKSRAGRKLTGERKLVAYTLRTDPEQRKQWQKAAKAAGMNLSQWIRQTLDKAAS